jgi:hypothetical protein
MMMDLNEIKVREKLYTLSARITEVTDFGVSIDAHLAGQSTPPPQGVRFDIAFEGQMEGARLSGPIRGVDYLRIRADGLMELQIHAAMRTADGASISVLSGGLARAAADGASLELREHVSFATAVSEYTWLNVLPVWAVGEVNLASGDIRVTGFVV